MNVTLFPSFAEGSVLAPPSKSMAHRALIAAALSPGESRLFPIADSQDMLATMDALTALGAGFTRTGEEILVKGMDLPKNTGRILPCRESGSTLRFLIPLCLLTGEKMTLTGSSRLMERPLFVYEDLCRERGFLFKKKENTLTVQGKLESGDYSVPGNISSQFITGLLYALAKLPGDSRIQVTGEMESASYLDMTVSAMAAFGKKVTREGQNFFISGEGSFSPRDYTVEGDWSNAAFLEGFQLLSGKVSVEGLREDSLQGDRVYRDHYRALKKGFATIDLSDCPDLGPVLFALAAAHEGALFTGTARLRIKESDRGLAMAEELKKCGVVLEIGENQILVPSGCLKPPSEPISSHNDHRIVMAMALLLSRFGGEIRGAEAVNKSYPDFFETIERLGIRIKKNETE